VRIRRLDNSRTVATICESKFCLTQGWPETTPNCSDLRDKVPKDDKVHTLDAVLLQRSFLSVQVAQYRTVFFAILATSLSSILD
jgi:hypothetical protein